MDSKLIRKLSLSTLAVILAAVVLSADFTQSFTDTFVRSDAANLGTNWSAGYTSQEAVKIVSNTASATSAGGADGVESVNASVPIADQWAQATLLSLPATNTGTEGVHVRMAAPATWNGYLCRARINTAQPHVSLERVDAGAFTAIATDSSINWASNDIISASAKGSLIRCFRNGTLMASATDTTYTTGRIGIFEFATTTATDMKMNNFQGGPLTTQAGFLFAFLTRGYIGNSINASK